MPTWSPNWVDVRFDQGAAIDAVAALRSAARRLDDQAGQRAALVESADAEWRGPNRDRFMQNIDVLRRDASALAQQMRMDASAVDSSAASATVEQRTRLDSRSLWIRLRDAEVLAVERAADERATAAQSGLAQAPIAW